MLDPKQELLDLVLTCEQEGFNVDDLASEWWSYGEYRDEVEEIPLVAMVDRDTGQLRLKDPNIGDWFDAPEPQMRDCVDYIASYW